MSKYTTELRFICETAAGYTESAGGGHVDNIIGTARTHIFDFNYPIFDENYRSVLETKIIRHYYTREISEETVGLWKLRLEDKMNLIMPYYNQLYESELIRFNPLYDVDLKTERSGSRQGKTEHEDNYIDNSHTTDTSESVNNYSNTQNNTTASEGKQNTSESAHGTGASKSSSNESTNNSRVDNTDATSTDWKLFSDTPQGGVTGIENLSDPSLLNMGYLTTAQKDTHVGNQKSTSDNTGITQNETTNTASDNRSTHNEQEYSNKVSDDRTEAGNRSITEERVNQYDASKEATGQRSYANTEAYVDHVVGKNAGHTYSHMLKEFRETFLNIDLMIIKELAPLFFNLW